MSYTRWYSIGMIFGTAQCYLQAAKLALTTQWVTCVISLALAIFLTWLGLTVRKRLNKRQIGNV